MKTTKVILFVLAFLFIVLAISEGISWLFYGAASLFLMEAIVEFLVERKKKAKATFLLYDRGKTLMNYGVIFGLLTLQYLLSAKQSEIALLFYLTWIVWVAVARAGDQYYIFDESGIKTFRKELPYQHIKTLHVTADLLEINVGTSKEVLIKRSLVNEQVLDYLSQQKMNKNQA